MLTQYRFYSEGDLESLSSVVDPFVSLRRTILQDYHFDKVMLELVHLPMQPVNLRQAFLASKIYIFTSYFFYYTLILHFCRLNVDDASIKRLRTRKQHSSFVKPRVQCVAHVGESMAVNGTSKARSDSPGAASLTGWRSWAAPGLDLTRLGECH